MFSNFGETWTIKKGLMRGENWENKIIMEINVSEGVIPHWV